MTEEVTNEVEKNQGAEMPSGEEGAADVNKQSPANEAEEKEPEDKVNVFLHNVNVSIIQMLRFLSINR